MQLAKRYVGTGIAILFVAGIAAQSLGTAQAEKLGYVQSDCPTIVKQAIDVVSNECSKAGRNKLCYGNSIIQAVFQPGSGSVTFQAPGDTVDVAAIQQFTLGAMDTSANTWGVAEMKIKADLPDNNPSQNVTMILFGDVQLTDGTSDANASAETPTSTPSTSKATRAVTTPTTVATAESTTTPVPVAQTPIPGPFKNLQAFYFQSKDSAPCDQAPHDGILIQSPQGKQRVTLVIDGATVSLGSTVYVTAQPGKFLTINVLEGSVVVTAAGQSQIVSPGFAVQVPLDANLHASGPPVAPQFYTSDAVRALPMKPLPNVIIAAPGFPANPITTQWTFTSPGVPSPCLQSVSTTGSTTITTDNTGAYLWYASRWLLGQIPRKSSVLFAKAANGSYQGSYRDVTVSLTSGQPIGTEVNDYALRFTDPTHIAVQKTFHVSFYSGRTCVVTYPVTLTEVTSPPASPSPSATP